MSAVSAPYHPGQTPWPDNQSQRPDRPPPIQFRPDDQEPGSNPVFAWILRIVGLLGVAVVSGAVWWYIQNEGTPGTGADDDGGRTPQRSEGKYEFKAEIATPRVDRECQDHAYGKTQDFFVANPCDRLTRSVFTTTADGDRTVYTSVSVVDFGSEELAVELQRLTKSDGTGNVSDLVKEKVISVDGLDGLSARGGYASQVQGGRITIVESDYDPQSSDGGSESELDDVSEDALRLGGDIADDNGG